MLNYNVYLSHRTKNLRLPFGVRGAIWAILGQSKNLAGFLGQREISTQVFTLTPIICTDPKHLLSG